MNDKRSKKIQVPKDIYASIHKRNNIDSKEKKIKKIKRISVVLSLSLVLISSTVIMNKEISANIKKVFGDIAGYLGLEEEMNKYATSINEPITQNGFTVSINQVLVDKNELIISSTLKSEEGKFKGQPEVDPRIKINGKLIGNDSNGVSEYIDDSTINKVDSYFLDNELEGDIKININYDSISLHNGSNVDSIKGPWHFEFTINSDALNAKTIEIGLNKQIKINDEEMITLNKYLGNEMGSIIEYERSTNNSEYALKLMGKDDLGNNIEFYTNYEQGGVGILKLDNDKDRISKDARELSLFVYTSKTLEEESWKQIGNELKLNIKDN